MPYISVSSNLVGQDKKGWYWYGVDVWTLLLTNSYQLHDYSLENDQNLPGMFEDLSDLRDINPCPTGPFFFFFFFGELA